MPRRVPAVLLALALLSSCSPAETPDRTAGSAAPLLAAPTPMAAAATTPAPDPVASAPDPALAADPVVPRQPTASPADLSAPPLEPPPAPADPSDTGGPPEPAAELPRPAEPVSVNLARVADFVPQYTNEWCVGASLQMARSIITDGGSESRRSQSRLWSLARGLSNGKYGGANPIGWAAALDEMGLGPYRLVSVPTFDEALSTAAEAISRTKRPVGLVMWAGRHAWVMTGYEATADPRRHDDARVTRVRVMDPLYPHGSVWGRSPAPNELVKRRTLAKQFVFRYRPDYDLGVAPGWLLVLPVR